jgi:polar amino acid transport system substrate-binding protein
MTRVLPVGVALAAAAVPLALGVGASAGAVHRQAASCDPSALPLVQDGTLTLATDNPAFAPWFGGGEKKGSVWKVNDPSTGKGYESAVAYAVARKLGFGPAKVKWVVVPFNKSFAPGKKSFDAFINQVSITPQRAKNVDFSSSYYNVSQSIVGVAGKPITKAKTIAALKPFRLGAQIGTTSLDVITKRIGPSQTPRVYDTNTDAVTALKNGQIDGLVVDLPTAFFVSAVQVSNGKVIGQFRASGKPEQFGMVLSKGSGLTACLNRALTQLRADGTIKRLEAKWLAGATAPVLK